MKRVLLFLSLTTTISCQSQEDKTAIVPSPIYYSIGITGSKEDVQTVTEFGLALMGGSTDVDAAIKWMIAKSGGGDFLIIRASGSTGYNEYIYGLGSVNSVETLLLNSKSKAENIETGKRIREAEAVFIAGGDQSDYVNFWSNTEVSKALNYLVNEKKVPLGGTSAGCAILSQIIFDAKQGSVVSAEALANPYNSSVSLSESFIEAPFLKNTVADQHYSQRERQGRHAAFMARRMKDSALTTVYGIGVDERTAICIDKTGEAIVFGQNKAYFLKAANGLPEVCEPNKKLTWDRNNKAIEAFIYQASSNGTKAFNLTNWPNDVTEYWYAGDGVLKKSN